MRDVTSTAPPTPEAPRQARTEPFMRRAAVVWLQTEIARRQLEALDRVYVYALPGAGALAHRGTDA